MKTPLGLEFDSSFVTPTVNKNVAGSFLIDETWKDRLYRYGIDSITNSSFLLSSPLLRLLTNNRSTAL